MAISVHFVLIHNRQPHYFFQTFYENKSHKMTGHKFLKSGLHVSSQKAKSNLFSGSIENYAQHFSYYISHDNIIQHIL